MTMRLGLLGGSFNPIHYGHLRLAAQTRDAMHLDRILFIPTGNPPHKPRVSLAPAAHRAAMVRLAIDGEPTFAMSDIELRRDGTSYSIDTIRLLQTQTVPPAQMFFIIGMDAFLDLPTWKEAGTLLRTCHFVVVSRPGITFDRLATMPLCPPIERELIQALDSGRRRDIGVAIPGGGELTLLNLPPCEISASAIRERILIGGGLGDLLPPSVESYIIRHDLYSEDSNRTGT